MKNQEKITEMKERIEASGIYEALELRENCLGSISDWRISKSTGRKLGMLF